MKNQNFTYKYKSSEYDFVVPPQSFTPTSTSFLLLETLIDQKDSLNFQRTLDLGCGIGFVALMLSKLKVNSNLIFVSVIQFLF
jgi:methylase of polypeptide subunit release factors